MVLHPWMKHIATLHDYSIRLVTLDQYSVHGVLPRADLIKGWKIFNEISLIEPLNAFEVQTD